MFDRNGPAMFWRVCYATIGFGIVVAVLIVAACRPAHALSVPPYKPGGASHIRTVDGDTVKVLAWLAPTLLEYKTIRVACVNTPERGESGYQEATDYTRAWMEEGPFTLTVYGRGGFARDVARLTRGSSDLGAELLDKGLAVPYRRVMPWCK